MRLATAADGSGSLLMATRSARRGSDPRSQPNVQSTLTFSRALVRRASLDTVRRHRMLDAIEAAAATGRNLAARKPGFLGEFRHDEAVADVEFVQGQQRSVALMP